MASSKGETANLTDSFNRAAQTYERRMGTAARSLAHHIVASLPPLQPNPRLCDNACGTGAVTQAFLETYPEAFVDATDNSAGMIELLKQSQVQQPTWKNVSTQVMDSVNLHFSADRFDVNIMNLGIFFVSDAQQAANEVYRTLRPGGTAVMTCWKEAAFFSIFFDVQNIVAPAKPIKELSFLEKWRKFDTLYSTMTSAGFGDVHMDQFQVLLTGHSISQLVESVAENIRGMVGTEWTEQDLERLYPATEEVLTSKRKEYLAIDTVESKGIPWTAWIASAMKDS